MKWIREHKLVSTVILLTLALIALRKYDPVKYQQFVDIVWDSLLYVAHSAKEIWKDLKPK